MPTGNYESTMVVTGRTRQTWYKSHLICKLSKRCGDVLDTEDEIVEADVLVRTVKIRTGVRDLERDCGYPDALAEVVHRAAARRRGMHGGLDTIDGARRMASSVLV